MLYGIRLAWYFRYPSNTLLDCKIMIKPDNQQAADPSVSDRAGTIGSYLILGFLGYALVFGVAFLWLAISGASAWYVVYVPLIAIPGILLGPAIIAWRKRKRV